MRRIFNLTFSARDPLRLGTFWSEAMDPVAEVERLQDPRIAQIWVPHFDEFDVTD